MEYRKKLTFEMFEKYINEYIDEHPDKQYLFNPLLLDNKYIREAINEYLNKPTSE